MKPPKRIKPPKPLKRISPSTLRTWLSTIKDMINARNYGMAENMIDTVMDQMETKYDWKRLKEIETE